MSSKSYRIAISRLKGRSPTMTVDDLHKIAEDYIRAGVRGADLIQCVMASSEWQLAQVQEFLSEHFPALIEEHFDNIPAIPPQRSNAPAPSDGSKLKCTGCGTLILPATVRLNSGKCFKCNPRKRK